MGFFDFIEDVGEWFSERWDDVREAFGLKERPPKGKWKTPEYIKANLPVYQEKAIEAIVGGKEKWEEIKRKLREEMQAQSLSLPSFQPVDIRLPDYSEVLKKLEERGREIYGEGRGRILEDLSKMRELTFSDLSRLLGMDVWEQPIRQATEIASREAIRFMDVAGLGGLGAAPLLMSEIVQKATQPLLIEKARGQQAIIEMAQRGLLDQIALSQKGLQELGAGFTEYMLGLPFKTFEQALREAQFKYSTAFRLFDLQLEPYRIILGAQSRYTPPPGFFEDLATYFSAILPGVG